MNSREQVISLINQMPDYKIGYVLAYVQGITAEDEADDRFCLQMIEDYENDPDPEKDREFSLEACKKEWSL